MAGDTGRQERNAGLLLIAAAAAPLAVANSPFEATYPTILHAALGPLTVEQWVADGAMALFFLLVGLEVKREWFEGRLATPAARRLPLIAAAAGMIVPANTLGQPAFAVVLDVGEDANAKFVADDVIVYKQSEAVTVYAGGAEYLLVKADAVMAKLRSR